MIVLVFPEMPIVFTLIRGVAWRRQSRLPESAADDLAYRGQEELLKRIPLFLNQKTHCRIGVIANDMQ